MGMFDDVPMAQQRRELRSSNPFADVPVVQGQQAPPPEQQEAPRGQPQSYAGGMIDSITQGYMGGFGPKITAAEAAVLGRTPEGDWFNYEKPMGERYSNALAAERAQNRQFAEENPLSDFAGETGGLVMSMARGPLGAVAKPITRMLPRASSAGGRVRNAVAAGGIEGGLAGGSYALGEDSDTPGRDALIGALMGAGIGGAVSGAGETVRGALRRRQVGRAARGAADDMADVRAASDTFKGENIAVSKDVLNRIMRTAEQRLAESGVDENMAPEAFRVFRTMANKASDESIDGVSLKYLNNLRRQVSKRAGTAQDGVERGASGQMLGAFDEVFDNLGQADVVAGGDAQAAVSALKGVREAYKRMLKAEEMDAVIEKAPFYAGGGQKGLQNQMRQIGRKAADPRNRRMGKGTASLYTPDDINTLKEAMDGTPGEKILDQVGRAGGFAMPGAGSNALGAAIGIGGGASVGSMIGNTLMPGPVGQLAGGAAGALATSGVGTAARAAAEKNALARANLARAIISGTKQLPMPGMGQRIAGDESARQALIEALIGAGIAAQNR